MTNKTKTQQQLSDEQILAEMKALSEKVKQKNEIQSQLFAHVDLGEEDLDTSFEEVLNTTADPETSHRLYYTTMMMMRANLPKANNKKPVSDEQRKRNADIKKFNAKIYAEKSLFLNRGKEIDDRGIRGSDERQTYIPNFLKVAYDMVHKWVAQGAHPWDLFLAFYELNKERGYRVEGVNEKKTLA
jgi:hypothetical protein